MLRGDLTQIMSGFRGVSVGELSDTKCIMGTLSNFV